MFEVGDTVDASVECSYPDAIGVSRIVPVVYRGKVLRLFPDDRIVVQFKFPCKPIRPGICNRCGFAGMILRDIRTGEFFCDAPTCGYGHGFLLWDSTFRPEKLVNISAQERDEKKAKH